MGNVSHKIRLDVLGNSSHPLEIDNPRIGTGTDRDHPGAMLPCQRRQLIVIDALIFLAHSVMDDVKKPAREIRFVSVSEMASVSQIHREHFVARLQESEV